MFSESIATGQKLYTFVVPTPFSVGPVNVYLIKGESLTLVDVGPKTLEAKDYLGFELKQLGYSFHDIEQVVLTHHHPDHCGLLNEFERASIVGHPKNEPWISKNEVFFHQMIDFFIDFYHGHGVEEALIENVKKELLFLMKFSCERSLTKELYDGDEIDGLPGWRVVETLGHAQSHISLHYAKKAMLIAGDHIIQDVSTNAIIEAPYDGQSRRPKTLLQYCQSLQEIKNLQLQKVFSGHGRVIHQVNDLIDLRLKGHEERASVIMKILDEKEMTAFEICKMLFPKIYTKETALTLSETIGHLDLLEDMKKVNVEVKDGITFYRKK